MKSTKKTQKIKEKSQDILTEDEFDPRHGKFRVTMFIDLDVLDEIRKRAADKRLPYQTFINQLLRELILGSDETEKIRQIVREELAKKKVG
jgi:predicted DNA binding CopG/RHH family protein